MIFKIILCSFWLSEFEILFFWLEYRLKHLSRYLRFVERIHFMLLNDHLFHFDLREGYPNLQQKFHNVWKTILQIFVSLLFLMLLYFYPTLWFSFLSSLLSLFIICNLFYLLSSLLLIKIIIHLLYFLQVIIAIYFLPSDEAYYLFLTVCLSFFVSHLFSI